MNQIMSSRGVWPGQGGTENCSFRTCLWKSVARARSASHAYYLRIQLNMKRIYTSGAPPRSDGFLKWAVGPQARGPGGLRSGGCGRCRAWCPSLSNRPLLPAPCPFLTLQARHTWSHMKSGEAGANLGGEWEDADPLLSWFQAQTQRGDGRGETNI